MCDLKLFDRVSRLAGKSRFSLSPYDSSPSVTNVMCEKNAYTSMFNDDVIVLIIIKTMTLSVDLSSYLTIAFACVDHLPP